MIIVDPKPILAFIKTNSLKVLLVILKKFLLLKELIIILERVIGVLINIFKDKFLILEFIMIKYLLRMKCLKSRIRKDHAVVFTKTLTNSLQLN